VARTADKNEKPGEYRAQSRSETRIVVPRALPLREPVSQEVIVTFSPGAFQNRIDEAESGEAVGGSFERSFDFGLAGTFGYVDGWLGARGSLGGRARGDELLLCFVGVKGPRALLVGFGELFLVAVGRAAEEVVEGYFRAFVLGDFVAEAEDLLV
jgi:hypothetical protein